MQTHTKLFLAAAAIPLAGAALAGLANAIHLTPRATPVPINDPSEATTQRDVYLDGLFGLATPTQR